MAEFEPVNELETRMLAALSGDDQTSYLRLLADAELILPAGDGVAAPAWATMEHDGQTYLAAYTSRAALAVSTTGQFSRSRSVGFRDLVAGWPDPTWSLVIDAGLPLAAHVPPSLIRQIAGGEFGDAAETPDTTTTTLLPRITEDDLDADLDRLPSRDGAFGGAGFDDSVPGDAGRDAADAERDGQAAVPTLMQKVIPPDQVPFYLDKGYDWVAGYVHRWQDVAGLVTVGDIVANLGLAYPGSPFSTADESVYLLRWTAYRAELYRQALGGSNEAAMAEIPGGWIVEHPPFTGAGQVTQSRLVIAEYKIDSIRLPHQAEMWRVAADGAHHFVAVYDADEQRWLVDRTLVREV